MNSRRFSHGYRSIKVNLGLFALASQVAKLNAKLVRNWLQRAPQAALLLVALAFTSEIGFAAERYQGFAVSLNVQSSLAISIKPSTNQLAKIVQSEKSPVANPKTEKSLLAGGLMAYRQGEFVDAARIFSNAARRAKEEANVSDQLDALIYLSDAYNSLGMKDLSFQALRSALPLVDREQGPQRLAALHARLGIAYQGFGQLNLAERYINVGISIAGLARRPELSAALWNDLGNIYISLENLTYAKVAFETSQELAEAADHDLLAARAGINLSRAIISEGGQDIDSLLDKILRVTRDLPSSREKAENLLAIGDLLRNAQMQFDDSALWRREAYKLCQEALSLAEKLGDQRLISYALGYLGRLYADEGRYTEALYYTRLAAFIAQRIGANGSLYRWEWHIARLLRAAGNVEEAITAYRQAINTYSLIRSDLIENTGSFGRLVGPIYIEFADLLFGHSASLADQQEKNKILREVLETLEQIKVAEIEDYYQHKCVNQVASEAYLDLLSAQTAVIYPLLLDDRLELLVGLPDGLHQFTTKIGANSITEQIRSLRSNLESANGGRQHLSFGKVLYDWIITPLETTLEKNQVHTLVIIPDGPLRSIPIAALHDGDKFLVEKYAVASSLGLSTTNTRPIARENMQVMLNGITEAVQGFDALPDVATELENISKLFPSNLYQDQDFVLATAKREISGGAYSIVHIASHARFDSDHRKSYLLTYDGKLTLNQLEQTIGLRRFQDDPLELLVLSACQTAVGDDRAALGLAGIALKAGARSALATLWLIDDEATSVLISEFYRQLKDTRLSKAKALQNAQLMLLNSERYRHPRFWAPFLMLGNWL